MNKNKISVLFLLQKARVNKESKCPIRCRITYMAIRKEFATGKFINPKQWYSKSQLAKPPNDENNNINKQLSLIKSKINRAFLLLQVKEVEFDVDDIYNQFVGKISTFVF